MQPPIAHQVLDTHLQRLPEPQIQLADIAHLTNYYQNIIIL